MSKNLRLLNTVDPLQVRIAARRPELAAAFELVYRSYLGRRFIEPHPGGVVYRKSFGLPTSRTLIATSQDNTTLGTLSIVGDNPLGLELEGTYPAEVESLRRDGRRLAEITCLAIQPSHGIRPIAVFFELTRLMIHYAYWRKLDDLLMAVHPRHYRFYWRHFRVWPFGPCRACTSVRGNPSIACRIDLHTLKQNVVPAVRRRYFDESFPEASLATPPIGPADHDYFLNRIGITWRADPADRREWGEDAA